MRVVPSLLHGYFRSCVCPSAQSAHTTCHLASALANWLSRRGLGAAMASEQLGLL